MNEVNNDGPVFATQKEVWAHLVAGGRIRPFHWVDAGYIAFNAEGRIVNHLGQAVNWTFQVPEEFTIVT